MFLQPLLLTTCIVFDKLLFFVVAMIESCFGFVWKVTLTKKTFQSIQGISHEVNVAQVDFHACMLCKCQNSYYSADGKRSIISSVSSSKNREKTIWCNKMGKVKEKNGFRVTKNTKVCHGHFNNEDEIGRAHV